MSGNSPSPYIIPLETPGYDPIRVAARESACNCCACNTSPCGCDPRPRRWLSRQKIKVSPDDTAITFSRKSCGLAADPSELKLYLRRRGQQSYVLAYPFFDTDEEGDYRVLIDSRVSALPAGRYEAQIRNGCDECGSIEIELPDVCQGVPARGQAQKGYVPNILNGTIEGLTNMFDQVVQFSAKICAVLEREGDTLPLLPADKARLCSATLCGPVQLLVFDGTKSETVEFSGCSAGEPTVVRAVAGTTAQKFPVGSVVCFSWTVDNVRLAAEGCP